MYIVMPIEGVFVRNLKIGLNLKIVYLNFASGGGAIISKKKFKEVQKRYFLPHILPL